MSVVGKKLRFIGLAPEDKARLVSYVLAIAWPIVFLIFPPASYSIISTTIIHLWMVVGTIGGIGGLLGVITGIDLKLELPALYFILVGPLLYFFAQIGFILQGNFQDRIALAVFVVWHICLMLPRIISLEAFRSHERARRKARL